MTQNTINTGSQVLQFIHGSSATVSTLTTVIPIDDTIPQNTEGHEILTITITPSSTTSTLVIEFVGNFTIVSGGNTMSAALFQDSTAGALSATNVRTRTSNTDDGGGSVGILYEMTSGTISSTTFKARMGSANTTNCWVNADGAGTRLMGGVQKAVMSVTEYL